MKSFIALMLLALNDYKLVTGDPAKGETTGQLTAARLQKQIDLLQEVGVLDKPVKVEDVVTFEFVGMHGTRGDLGQKN